MEIPVNNRYSFLMKLLMLSVFSVTVLGWKASAQDTTKKSKPLISHLHLNPY